MAASNTPTLPALFSAYGPRVYRRALRLLGNAADAEEATQEVFIRVLQGIGRFDQQAEITTWLHQITTNYCLNAMRDRARRRELDEEKSVAPSDQVDAGHDALLLVRRLLERADEREGLAAVCVHLDGMSHDEAAAVVADETRVVPPTEMAYRDAAGKETPYPVSPALAKIATPEWL